MLNVNFLNPKGMPLRLLSRSLKTLNHLRFGSVQVQPKLRFGSGSLQVLKFGFGSEFGFTKFGTSEV